MLKRFLAVGLTMVVGATPLRAQNVGVPASLDDGLEVAAPGMVGLRLEPLAALKQPLVDVSFPNTTSVLVLKDGRLVFERYFGIGGPDVLNDTRSAMKSVTALAVGAALGDGALRSLEDPAFSLMADLAPFKHDGVLKRRITLADLMTMSSALDCNDWDDTSPGNEENMYPLRDWTRWAVDIPVEAIYERDETGRGRSHTVRRECSCWARSSSAQFASLSISM